MQGTKNRFFVIVLLGLLAGCAGVRNPTDMDHQERAAFALALYNNAHANYLAQFAATPQPIGEEMQEYFRAYKRVMEFAWPTIYAYASAVQAGAMPTIQHEQEVVAVIAQLQSLLTRQKGNT